jgi:hypothetical protein
LPIVRASAFFVAEYEGGVAGNDEQPGHPGQAGNQLFGKAIGKVFLLRIAAHVAKRKDGDGRLVQWWSGSCRRGARNRWRSQRQQQSISATMTRFHEPGIPRVIAERTP